MQVDSQYLKTTKTKKMKTKSSFRLTLHCGDDEPVTPGALLSISLKKQGQVLLMIVLMLLLMVIVMVMVMVFIFFSPSQWVSDVDC